jgi:hypothetical protein
VPTSPKSLVTSPDASAALDILFQLKTENERLKRELLDVKSATIARDRDVLSENDRLKNETSHAALQASALLVAIDDASIETASLRLQLQESHHANAALKSDMKVMSEKLAAAEAALSAAVAGAHFEKMSVGGNIRIVSVHSLQKLSSDDVCRDDILFAM